MTGTFGPALTIDNDLRGILEFLGPRPPERDLVAHYDVSHVALPSTRWRFLVENTDVTDMAPAVFVKSIRGASIQMRRMTPVGHGMTPFDSLLDAFFVGDTVRARGLADRLMAAHPENLMLQQLDAKIRYLSRDLSGTLTALEHLSEQNPDNYDVQYDCAAMCAKCYWASRARQVYRMVQRYVDRCRRLDAPETPSVDELLQITKPSGR